MSLLSVSHLTKRFPIRRGMLQRVSGYVHAVNEVNLTLAPGETLGLVGESGCGKTTLGRSILRLIEPSSGHIYFEGQDVLSFDHQTLLDWRCQAQMIFQDPYGSLNPRMKVKDIVSEGLVIHKLFNRQQQVQAVEEALDTVGLPASIVDRYPHEFSGGQRQRIGIARALVLQPKLIIADEPVSALDVSIAAQIVNLLIELQESKGIGFIFISHDLRVVEYISHRIAVMYLGQVMEVLPAHEVNQRAQHPYTKALLAAVPMIGWQSSSSAREPLPMVLEGDVPSSLQAATGCPFVLRCPVAEHRCNIEPVKLLEKEEDHWVACHLV